MSSSSFLLPLNPPLSIIQRHKPQALPLLALSKSSFSLSLCKSHVCFLSSSSSSSSNSSGSDSEELLWLREEQRWLREEQRWLREEQRWLRERDSLLSEIQSLKLQIQALEKRISVVGGESVPDTAANVGALLQFLKERSLILESGSSTSPIVLEEKVEDKEEAVGVVEVKKEEKKRKPLRKGSEGAEVREMQVCSQ